MKDKYGTKWTWDETTLALYLYCQIPFERTKRTEPAVRRLASLIGRTPSAVARKLGNLGAFDKRLADQGISGLSHTSRLDREVWEQFEGRWEQLVETSSRILARLDRGDPIADTEQDEPPILPAFSGPTEREAVVRIRRAQTFFRRTVLASYGGSCAFCGLDIPELVVASHIVPWAVREDLRAEPRNGLALCAIHDRAYDRGLVAVDSDHRLVVSSKISRSRSKAVEAMLGALEGRSIILPSRFLPLSECLRWHAENVFHQT